jgi:hypothetical protein
MDTAGQCAICGRSADFLESIPAEWKTIVVGEVSDSPAVPLCQSHRTEYDTIRCSGKRPDPPEDDEAVADLLARIDEEHIRSP